MFTGIVEEMGTLVARQGNRITVAANAVLENASIGDSISLNGCCLTVVALGDGQWEADLADETLRRTTHGSLAPGAHVNLERPVRLSDRLGGHLVQGHVDAVGTVLTAAPELRVQLPDDLMRYVVEKGSITIDGVSLTVAAVFDDGCGVAIIPHTAAVTTIGSKQPGDTVNIEVDVMAKYAERLLGFMTDRISGR